MYRQRYTSYPQDSAVFECECRLKGCSAYCDSRCIICSNATKSTRMVCDWKRFSDCFLSPPLCSAVVERLRAATFKISHPSAPLRQKKVQVTSTSLLNGLRNHQAQQALFRIYSPYIQHCPHHPSNPIIISMGKNKKVLIEFIEDLDDAKLVALPQQTRRVESDSNFRLDMQGVRSPLFALFRGTTKQPTDFLPAYLWPAAVS